jgi:two-component system sensor histidine kinase UhpB
VLEISDDGIGLPEDRQHDGSGIRGMRERALMIGAQLDVVSRPEGGTRVRLMLAPRRSA